MRLICPNCGAQYEVGADVIPDGGRDVQCSNCGHTWFENPDAPTAGAEEDGFVDTPPVTMPAPPQSKQTPPPPTLARTQLDPSIADILREEAAREQEARKAETAGGLEDQPELGLTDPPPRPIRSGNVDPVAEGRNRVDRLQGRAATAAAPITTGSRKELFPDIEEINSTLRSNADRNDLPPMTEAAALQSRRSGWRGFMSMIALIVILTLVYAKADGIAAAVPALADALANYVAAVDSGRLWLDTQVQMLLGKAASN